MKKHILFTIFFSLMCISSAFAQNTKSLERDINNLKEEFAILQRRIYETGSAGATADNIVRLGELEESTRQIKGQIDTLEHSIRTLDEKIDRINKDVDVRINLIEGKPIKGLGTTQPAPKFNAPQAATAPASITGAAIAGTELAAPENKELQAIYQKGLEDLRAANYDEAEKSFNQILSKYPKDRLAGNAQYWLGETFYGKKEYDKAAVNFAKGYQNYKDGSKGPDSLLKLGLSMKALNKTAEACAAFLSMPAEFPNAEASISTKAKEEAKNLKCK